MLKKYFNFKEDLLLEKLLLESIVYLSPKLRKRLNNIDSPISTALKEIEGNDIKKDFTFIDLDEKEGYVTFKTMKNAKKQIEELYPDHELVLNMDNNYEPTINNNLYDLKSPIWTKSRNPIKIGRLVNNMFPGKFNQQEIEDFTNKYKSTQIKKEEQLRVVEGDEIYNWYQEDNYMEKSGQLGSSCMRRGRKSWFDIYTKNPEVCKMLILTHEDESGEEKLLGRAIVWKLSKCISFGGGESQFEWFMDRQYTIKDSDVEKMRKYADEQNWGYKSNNNHHSFTSVTYKGETKNYTMTVNLKKADDYSYDYENYPYVDTFRRYDPNNGTLFNDDDDEGFYLLQDTGGGYDESRGDRVWSEYHDELIHEDDAIWCEAIDSYILLDYAVEVTTGYSGHRGWYPNDYEYITKDEWNDEWIHTDDAVYSERYDYYILQDEAMLAIEDIEKDGEPYRSDDNWVHEDDNDYIDFYSINHYDWFEKMDNEHHWENNGYGAINKDLLIKDSEGDWILKILQVNLFKLKQSIKGVNWLSEIDAKALDLDLDKENKKIGIIYDYNTELLEKGLIKPLISGFNRILKDEQLKLDFPLSSDELVNNVKHRISSYKKQLTDRKWELMEILEENE